MPVVSSAATVTPFTYSGWIPYWKLPAGITDAFNHISTFTEISPFGYSVHTDGTLADTAGINTSATSSWNALFNLSRGQGVEIVPTVMWSDQATIYRILSNTALRTAHVAQIVNTVNANNFAGIDVDYENKSAATEKYYSAFLKQLSSALHKNKKILVCSTESRTPLSSRFAVIPKTVAYANDYTAINTYCDEVRIMAYDQDNVDIKLNASKGGATLYQPIADVDWVKKVLTLTLQSINRKKVVLAVPTYGREYQIATSTNGTITYTPITSVTYTTAIALAAQNNVTPVRNSAGELSYTFTSGTSTMFADFTDAQSVASEIAVAKAYGLKGASVFKIDGDEDPSLFTVLK